MCKFQILKYINSDVIYQINILIDDLIKYNDVILNLCKLGYIYSLDGNIKYMDMIINFADENNAFFNEKYMMIKYATHYNKIKMLKYLIDSKKYRFSCVMYYDLINSIYNKTEGGIDVNKKCEYHGHLNVESAKLYISCPYMISFRFIGHIFYNPSHHFYHDMKFLINYNYPVILQSLINNYHYNYKKILFYPFNIKNGCFDIYTACEGGYIDVIKVLFKIDYIFEYYNDQIYKFTTLLFIACKYNHDEIVKLLLDDSRVTFYINENIKLIFESHIVYMNDNIIHILSNDERFNCLSFPLSKL